MNYLIIILLIIVTNNRQIDKSKESLLSLYKPQFKQTEVLPSETSCYIPMESLPWYPNSIIYSVYLSEMNSDEWDKDMHIYQNWKYSDEEIIQYTKNTELLWKPWTPYYQGTKRIIYVDSLSSGSYYRVRYTVSSKFTTSQYSEIKFIGLKRNNKKVNVYMRGTGRNNHGNAIIKLNNNIILEHGKFQGLAVIALNRRNLKVDTIQLFDTYTKNSNVKTETVTYTKYSYDDDGNIITSTETTTVEKSLLLENDNKLQKFIKSIKDNQFILLVSCYGWEQYFTYKTAELLARYGALKIKELSYSFYQSYNEDKFQFESILPQNKYHHPYAFIGIRNLGMGNGFEVVQTNKGHYISTENLPQAEIIVTLSFNEYNRAYYFDRKQKYRSHYNLINHSFLNKADDLTLKNVFSLLVYANITSKINTHFDIYDWNTDSEHLISFDPSNDNNNNVYQTELDRMVVGNGIGVMRSYFKGGIYQNGKNVYNLEYYYLYLNTGLKGIECSPPYTPNGKECIDPNIVDNYSYDIPIIMCGIGLAPQICKDNKEYSNPSFEGFN